MSGIKPDPQLIAAIDARSTVLVAHRRAAYALRFLYARHAMASGRQAWLTPDVLTVRAWLERAWLAHRVTQSAERLLSDQQVAVLWEHIVGASRQAESLLNPAAAARAAARSWSVAQAYGISLDDIEQYCRQRGEEEGLVYAEWARTFEATCASRQWLAPATLAKALRDLLPSVDQRLHIDIREPLTPIVAQLFARLRANGAVIQHTRHEDPPHPSAVFGAQDERHEIQAAALWARQQLDAGKELIGIAVPGLQYKRGRVQRALQDALMPSTRRLGVERENLPYTLGTAGYLTEFPVVRVALDCLALVAGRAPSTLAGLLLRSPFIGGYELEAGARARADVRLRNEGREQFDCATLERLAGLSGCADLARRLEAVRPLVTANLQPKSASAWAEQFLAIWRTLGWPGDRTPNSVEQQTIAKLHGALGDFGALDDLVGRLSFPRALQEFEQCVSAIAFEPQSLPTPIVVVDFEQAADLKFDALWVTGCEATRWPAVPAPDPFLPLALQLKAGIPEASPETVRQRAYEQCGHLQAAADTVVFSWPRHEEDAELTPSPLLAGLPEALSIPVAGTRYRDWLHRSRPPLEVIEDSRLPVVAAGRTRGGARILELQAWCPFRAQTELRLAARQLEQVKPGVDPRLRGTLLHRALEIIWGEIGGSQQLGAMSPEQVRTLVRATVDSVSLSLSSGMTDHQLKLMTIEVQLATDKICTLMEQERTRPPFQVVDRPEIPQSYRHAGLELDLRIDRIDRLLDRDQVEGDELVIDYKSGRTAMPNKWWGARPEQPQLPLYAVARRQRLAGVAFAILHARETGFRGILRDEALLPGVPGHARARHLPAAASDWQSMLDHWQATVENLIERYAVGDAQVDPLPGICERCHLASVCRIHELRLQPISQPVDA